MFDKDEWHLEQELDTKTNEMKIVIMKHHGEEIHVIRADGTIAVVPHAGHIDEVCGPTLRVNLASYKKYEEGLKSENKTKGEFKNTGSFEETMKFWRERCSKAEARLGQIYQILCPDRELSEEESNKIFTSLSKTYPATRGNQEVNGG